MLIHQPALSGQQGGQASDIEIHANEVMRMREWTAQTLALHSGKTYEEVDLSIERDNILTAAAALSTAWSIRCWSLVSCVSLRPTPLFPTPKL